MKVKNKNVIIASVITFIFTALLSCGIFAVVTKSVSFNLALKLDPQIYFSLSMKIDYNGDGNYTGTHPNNTQILESSIYKIFDNSANAGGLVNWATVNQNCIVLNQVLAGDILSNLTINSRFEITVTNLTSTSEVEYLNLTLNYNGAEEVFKISNGYGAVNMKYNSADEETKGTKTFTLIPQTTLLDGYIQIPFLAEIDTEKRYTATITTENCDVVTAPTMFKKNTTFKATFDSAVSTGMAYLYTVTVAGNSYSTLCSTNELIIPDVDVTGDITINAKTAPNDYSKNAVWDGGIATNFAGGSGTEDNPFLISTARQLMLLSYLTNNRGTRTSYFGDATNNGITTAVTVICDKSVTFCSAHYKMTDNITLNDATFDFNADTGLVKVVKGATTFYLGTNIPGETLADNNNSTFDSTASVAGSVYLSETSTSTATASTYLNSLIQWVPIGDFYGVFDGDGYYVEGMYFNNSLSSGVGVFKVNYDIIHNLGIESGYVLCYTCGAGIVAANLSVVESCYNKAIIIPIYYNTTYAEVLSGGIIGYSRGFFSAVRDCYNEGACFGMSNRVGGIVGHAGLWSSPTGTNDSTCFIKNCYNLGKIHGKTGQTGGITGLLSLGVVSSSYNFGKCNYGSVVGHLRTLTFVDPNYYDNPLRNNYFLSGTATYGIYEPQSSPAGQAEELATVGDMIKSMKNNWDFVDTWEIKSGNTYPTLKIFNKG